eukprot:gnl/Ergobibamus_cyprinoides/678.p2 GENE.gnl/Ergobibamus_cyprinoides/678~~gnl/Ergobibamus_cyprinoides/678.p2  ORF type:complete len:334 (+),score=81.37 gnl/Ergobibamus_cyprinoides/678:115-1002(+)
MFVRAGAISLLLLRLGPLHNASAFDGWDAASLPAAGSFGLCDEEVAAVDYLLRFPNMATLDLVDNVLTHLVPKERASEFLTPARLAAALVPDPDLMQPDQAASLEAPQTRQMTAHQTAQFIQHVVDQCGPVKATEALRIRAFTDFSVAVAFGAVPEGRAPMDPLTRAAWARCLAILLDSALSAPADENRADLEAFAVKTAMQAASAVHAESQLPEDSGEMALVNAFATLLSSVAVLEAVCSRVPSAAPTASVVARAAIALLKRPETGGIAMAGNRARRMPIQACHAASLLPPLSP